MKNNSSEEKTREAFSKIKSDIFNLQTQIFQLSREMNLLNNQLYELTRTLTIPTNQHIIPTDNQQADTTPAEEEFLPDDKTFNNAFSTGNEGVPTDRQTDRQTDQHIQKFAQTTSKPTINNQQESQKLYSQYHKTTQSNPHSSTENLPKILNELSNITDNFKTQIQNLTQQEFLIFSTLYQLEQQGQIVDYKLLSAHLNLAESSIRDYILKITKKGIPVEKKKIHNKKVIISILPHFKQLASLNTITQIYDQKPY